MKLFNLKTLALTTAITSVFFAGSVMAQNVITVPAEVSVQNAITLAQIDPMEFATIVAINDATETASASIAITDVVSFTTTGAPAFMQAVTGTPTAAEITVAGVVGATINMTLNNVVNPINGTDVFTLDTFVAGVNGGASTAVVVGTPFSHTALALDTILVGARITTPAQVTQIADVTYAGSFDLVASY